MEEIHNTLLKELELVVEPLGIQVVELSVYHGKSGLNIRAVIFRGGGVTLGDCERVTRLYNDRLTILEPIDENNYTLQISSPGVDRIFKDRKEYNIFKSRHVKIMVDNRVEGSEGGVIRGVLEGLEDDRVKLLPDFDPDKPIKIPLESIRKTRLDDERRSYGK